MAGLFDDGKPKPRPTQRFRDPETGRTVSVNHNDGAVITELKQRGWKEQGGVNERGCHKYEIRNGG